MQSFNTRKPTKIGQLSSLQRKSIKLQLLELFTEGYSHLDSFLRDAGLGPLSNRSTDRTRFPTVVGAAVDDLYATGDLGIFLDALASEYPRAPALQIITECLDVVAATQVSQRVVDDLDGLEAIVSEGGFD